MMVAFRGMTYFKVSLSTRNWDSANKKARHRCRAFSFSRSIHPCLAAGRSSAGASAGA